jgi:hypothetical protein
MDLTTKELIRLLKEYPDDFIVHFQGNEKGFSELDHIGYDESLKSIYINITKSQEK